MKIIDTFTFFNELMLLDVRLNVLHEHVDEFVLVEATRSHQNKPKPLFYEENKHLFDKFNHKITHIVVDRFPEHTYWSHENYQRDVIASSLSHLDNNDIVFISDLDEIWNPEILLPTIAKEVSSDKIYRWQSLVCYFYFNLVAWHSNWIQPMYMKYSFLKKLTEQGYTISKDILRGRDQSSKPQLDNIVIDGIAGWHFSYTEDPIYKLQNFLHSELRNMSEEEINDSILKGVNPFHKYCNMRTIQPSELESHLPKYIWNNLEKFKHKIYE